MSDRPESFQPSEGMSSESCATGEEQPGPRADNAEPDAPAREPGQCLMESFVKDGGRVVPGPLYTSVRRSRLQRQQEVSDAGGGSAPQRALTEASEKGSVTPAMRRKYLKELLLSNGGFGSIFPSSETEADGALGSEENGTGTFWALDPLEHAWMLAVVDGNCETILDFLSEDSSLLTRKDFVSGFTVLHWLAKYGKAETIIQLLKHAEKEGLPVNVNLKASGGFTPLHIAAMHCQYMVVKILVGAFGANIEAMDYSGRRPWQYLKNNAPTEMKELLGTWDDEHGTQNKNNNSSGSSSPVPGEEEGVTDSFNRRNSSWRFQSLKKLVYPWLPFVNRS